MICLGIWRSVISDLSFPERNNYSEVPVNGDDAEFPDECETRK